MVAAGIDVATISQALGHATVGFTLGIYTHPTEAMTAPLATTAESQLGEALASL